MQNTALITGASKRIGKAMAIFLAQKKYNLVLHYNNSQQEAIVLAQDLSAKYTIKCDIVFCDLQKDVTDFAKNIFIDFPQINLLINNASIFHKSKFLDPRQQQLEQNLNVHLFAPLILSHFFAKNCLQHNLQSAQIINMVDKNIVRYDTTHFFYLLSKKSLAEATKMLALELAPQIRVNAIAPGFILSSVHSSNPELEQQQMANIIPLKFTGNTSNILQAMDFLLSNQFITGQIIFVDGGASLNHAG
jgi:NAD(P)-dependent dehydrogenase (short-subunit alcohol dehydrogenase family)